MDFRIRVATLKDTKALSKLECSCYGTAWSEYANWHWKVAIKCAWAFKAVYKNKIIGGLIGLPTKRETVFVDTIIVSPRLRGKGIGTSLLKGLMMSTKGKRIEMAVDTRYKWLISAYSKLGFRKIKLLKNYYDEGIDYFLMRH